MPPINYSTITRGTAPGIMAESQGKLLFVLPGVPSEMKRMFEESVLPELQRFAGGQAVVVKKLNCFGAGESTIAQRVGTIMQTEPRSTLSTRTIRLLPDSLRGRSRSTITPRIAPMPMAGSPPAWT